MQLDSPRRCSAYSSLQQSFQRKSVSSLSNKEFQWLAESVANTLSCATKNTTLASISMIHTEAKTPRRIPIHGLPSAPPVHGHPGCLRTRRTRSPSQIWFLGKSFTKYIHRTSTAICFPSNWWPNAQVSKITSYIWTNDPLSLLIPGSCNRGSVRQEMSSGRQQTIQQPGSGMLPKFSTEMSRPLQILDRKTCWNIFYTIELFHLQHKKSMRMQANKPEGKKKHKHFGSSAK